MGLAGDVWVFFASRVPVGLTKQTSAVGKAYITDVSHPQERYEQIAVQIELLGYSVCVLLCVDLYCTVLCLMFLCCVVLCCVVLCCVLLCFVVFCCAVLCCVALCCIVILGCVVLHRSVVR